MAIISDGGINMEDRLKNTLRFYLLATRLQDKIRTGWDKNHWNIQKERIESVSEHIYDTCILALAIDSEFETNLDINKVIKMLVLHEIGEVIIGDITPFDHISLEEKKQMEHEAIKEVLGDLIKKDEYYSLLLEFDEHKTKESIFAYHCDKFDADLRAKIYQDMGCQKSLNEQEDNVVIKSEKIQQLMKDGAKTAFDIWYEWDKAIYAEDEKFSKLLEYLSKINTQEIN
jgi:putative hydrolase of HD superfamily